MGASRTAPKSRGTGRPSKHAKNPPPSPCVQPGPWTRYQSGAWRPQWLAQKVHLLFRSPRLVGGLDRAERRLGRQRVPPGRTTRTSQGPRHYLWELFRLSKCRLCLPKKPRKAGGGLHTKRNSSRKGETDRQSGSLINHTSGPLCGRGMASCRTRRHCIGLFALDTSSSSSLLLPLARPSRAYVLRIVCVNPRYEGVEV